MSIHDDINESLTLINIEHYLACSSTEKIHVITVGYEQSRDDFCIENQLNLEA